MKDSKFEEHIIYKTELQKTKRSNAKTRAFFWVFNVHSRSNLALPYLLPIYFDLYKLNLIKMAFLSLSKKILFTLWRNNLLIQYIVYSELIKLRKLLLKSATIMQAEHHWFISTYGQCAYLNFALPNHLLLTGEIPHCRRLQHNNNNKRSTAGLLFFNAHRTWQWPKPLARSKTEANAMRQSVEVLRMYMMWMRINKYLRKHTIESEKTIGKVETKQQRSRKRLLVERATAM